MFPAVLCFALIAKLHAGGSIGVIFPPTTVHFHLLFPVLHTAFVSIFFARTFFCVFGHVSAVPLLVSFDWMLLLF